MKCKEYVFLISSGQMREAPTPKQLEGRAHWLMCRHCRAFGRNDQALSQIVEAMKARLQAKGIDDQGLQDDPDRAPP